MRHELFLGEYAFIKVASASMTIFKAGPFILYQL